MLYEFPQKLPCAGPVTGMDAPPGVHERTNERRPKGALVVRRIAGPRVAALKEKGPFFQKALWAGLWQEGG